MSMNIRGNCKQSIMDDIFGRKIGSVFESGLSDAGGAEKFIARKYGRKVVMAPPKWKSLPLLVWVKEKGRIHT